MPSGAAARLLGRTVMRSLRSRFATRASTAFFCAHALPQRFHKVYHVRGPGLFWALDLFALLLLLQQVLERVFVAIFKLRWIELTALGIHDMRCEFEHVLGNFLVLDVVKVVLLVTHLVGVPQ